MEFWAAFVLAWLLLVLVVPIVILVRRFREGDQIEGTSWGRQLFGRRREPGLED